MIVDWRNLFDFSAVDGVGAGPFSVAKKLDTRLAAPLGRLPDGSNLAARNLIRGSRLGVPCGQDVAALMAAAGGLGGGSLLESDQIVKREDAGDPHAAADNAVLREYEFDVKTPLWYYILREAEIEGGTHLGPVGSRIVLETFVGLIRSSVTSIFEAKEAPPGMLNVFSPKDDSTIRLEGNKPITTMAHLLAFVGDINPLGDAPPTLPVQPPASQ